MGHALSILSAAHESALEKKTSLDLLSLSQEETETLQQAWSEVPQAFKEKLFANGSDSSDSDRTATGGISPQLKAQCPRGGATEGSKKRRRTSRSPKRNQDRSGRASAAGNGGTAAQSEPHSAGEYARKGPRKKRRIDNPPERKESALTQALERWESDPATFWRTPALDLTTSPWDGFRTYLKQPKDKLTATQTHLLAVVCHRVKISLGPRLNTQRRMKISDAVSGSSHDEKLQDHLSWQARLGSRIENLCKSIEGDKNDDAHLSFLFCLDSVSYTTLRNLPVDEIPAESIKKFKGYNKYSPALKQRLQKLSPRILSFILTPIAEKILPAGQIVFNATPSSLNNIQVTTIQQASIPVEQLEAPAERSISSGVEHDLLPAPLYAGSTCEPVPSFGQPVPPGGSQGMLGQYQLGGLDYLDMHSGPFLREEDVNQAFLEAHAGPFPNDNSWLGAQVEPFSGNKEAVLDLHLGPFVHCQTPVPQSSQDANPEDPVPMAPESPHMPQMEASTAPAAYGAFEKHQASRLFIASTAPKSLNTPGTPRFFGSPPARTIQSNLLDDWRYSGAQNGFLTRVPPT